MNLKTEFLTLLKEQLKIEIESRDRYTKFLKEIDVPKFRTTIRKIEKDEEDHIEIVMKLIKLVEDYGKPLNGKKGIKKDNEALRINQVIDGANSILFLSDVNKYIYQLKRIIKEYLDSPKKKVIYVSYNKIPKYTKKILSEYNIDTSKILFINCVGVEDETDISIKPQELTKLAIVINESIKNLEKPLVIIDTLSAFSVYHDINLISKFVASMNDSARRKNCVLFWVAIKEESEKNFNSRLSGLCDKVIGDE